MFEGQKRLLDEDQGGQLSSSGPLCESCAELGDAGGSLPGHSRSDIDGNLISTDVSGSAIVAEAT